MCLWDVQVTYLGELKLSLFPLERFSGTLLQLPQVVFRKYFPLANDIYGSYSGLE
jgi:hypothetical protein